MDRHGRSWAVILNPESRQSCDGAFHREIVP
jgi:hypothetical protein